MTYLRPVCLQPDPADGSFNYFACSGGSHWAKHSSEPSSDGFEVRGTSRKLLHARGESPSAPNAAFGTADNPAAQPDHHPARIGTNGPCAADPHANFAIATPNGRPSNHRASHSNVAGHPQDAATSQPSAHYDANHTADFDRAATGNVTKRPGGVHPGQFSLTHAKTAGRFGSAGDAGPASTAQQCTQHPAAWPSDRGRGTCAKHRRGPHTAHQHHATPFGDRARSTAPTLIRATRSTTKGETDAPSALQGPQQKPLAATAPTPSQVQEPLPRPTIPQPQSAQNLQLNKEWMTKWSYRAPPPQHTGPREGFSQSSQPQMEARAPSASCMDLTQEATTAPQQPPSRFRPSNYTVDLSNTTNPPPPQVMVKPAVMLRRDERPEPVSFSVTDAAQLSRTLSAMGSGSGIPEATYSELAAILLSSGRRDQAIDISSEVMAISEGAHQILFIPWAGRERTTFGMEEGETGSYCEYTWAHGTSPSGLLGILSEDLVRPSAQDLKIEGTEKVQATAVYGSAAPGPWSSYSLQTILAQAIKRPKAYTHGMVVCGTILSKHQRYKCDFRDTRKEHASVARRGVVRTPERWGFHAGHLTIKGIAIFAP